MISVITLQLALACLVSMATLSLAAHSVGGEGGPPPFSVRVSPFGRAYKDPCNESWSNDEKTWPYPCPTASPTVSPAPTAAWELATISKRDICPNADELAARSTTENVVSFYYSVETTPEGNPDQFLERLENALLMSTAMDVFKPCEGDTTTGGQTSQKRASGGNVDIAAISSLPVDTNLFSCVPKVDGNNCYVLEGRKTITNDKANDPEEIQSTILSSIEQKMSEGDLPFIDTIEEVTYIGSSMDDVLAALGPEETVAEYYYKVEGTPEADPEAFLSDIEAGMHKDALKEMLSNPSIGAVGSDPIDTQIFTCVPDLAINTCFIYKGEMTVLHKDDISSEDANAIMNASVERTASRGDLESIEDVEKVTYIGSSMDDVLAALGPEETVAEYYYKVEGTPEADPEAFLSDIEAGMHKDALKEMLSNPSIGAVGSDPINTQIFTCVPDLAINTCFIYKGEMTVLHKDDISSEDANAIMNASVERTASSGDLESIEDVEEVTYIGSSMDDVLAALGPEETVAEFYYKVEGTPEADPEAFLSDIEAGMHKDALKEMLSNPSIGAVGSDPIDTEILSCIPERNGNSCYIFKGEMTVRHKDDISSEDANTIINELVKKTASSGDLESIEDVEKVTYIGSSMDDVLAALGPESTVAEFYYKVEGTPHADPKAFLSEIEDGMRKDALEEMLSNPSIGAVGSDPIDTEMFLCDPEIRGNTCYVFKGEMTVLHTDDISSEDANAIMNASVKKSALSGDLESIEDVEKVTYLGPEIAVAEFYYKVEGTPEADPEAFLSEIEDGMLKGTSGDSVANPSISFVGADPKDTEILSCVPKDADNTCYIFKGEMTAVHDDKISAEDVNAIMNASVERTASSGDLKSIEDVEEVTYIGSSMDDVLAALGPEETVAEFYYKVEGTPEADPEAFLSDIEAGMHKDALKEMLSNPSIGAVGSDPINTQIFTCVPDLAINTCFIYKGEMTVRHKDDISSEDANAIMNASVERTASSGDLKSIEDVEEVTYIGSSMDDVLAAFGPEETVAEYYYKVEGTPEADPEAFLSDIEAGMHKDALKEMLSNPSIGAVGSDPIDTQIFTCVPNLAINTCFIYKGEMTVLHKDDISSEDANAIMNASVERTASSGDLESIEDVEEVTYIGSSMDDVLAALGPEETVAEFYYKVEGTPEADPEAFLSDIEAGMHKDALKEMLSNPSIGAVGSDPIDTEILSCIPERNGNSCYIFKGEMTVRHKDDISSEDANTIINELVKKTASSGDLESIEDVEKVTYIGSSMDDVLAALGPESTVAEFYYKVEGTPHADPKAFLSEIEDGMRKDALEEMLSNPSIGAVGSDPIDTEMFLCDPEIRGNTCYVFKGEMTVLHTDDISSEDANAIMNASVKKSALSGDLESIEDVEKVTYLGPEIAVAEFYYKVEGTPEADPEAFLSEIEDGMLKGTSGDSVANPSISFVGADPKGTEILSCVPKDADNTCYIFKGEMTAVHDDKISAEDVNAIMNASVERTASSGDLKSIEDVEEVTYIGSSMDDVLAALGPEETVAEFYYKVEGTPEADPEAFLSDIEAGMHKDALKEMLSNPSIGAVGSDPIDTQIFTCVPNSAINTCFIYKGEMTVLHKDDISSEDANAIMNASVERTASSGDLESIEDVEEVTYIGSSMDDVLAALGPEETVAEFYYKVEGTPEADPEAFLSDIEAGMHKDALKEMLSNPSIGAVGSDPIDTEILSCIPERNGNSCYIFKGEMTVRHKDDISSEDANTIINELVKKTASSGDLESIEDVEKVTYIGSSMDDVLAALGPESTVAEFYYKVEGTPHADPKAFLSEIEDGMRKDALEEMLSNPSIGAVGSDPIDTEMFLCDPEIRGNTCYVFKGEMTVLHTDDISSEDANAIMNASVKKSALSGDLESIEDVEKVTYLGPEIAVAEFYYKVEGTPEADPEAFLSEIEDGMLKGTSGDSVANPSISFVGADPKGTEILSCVPKDADNTCYIFKGEMTAVHDDKISAEDVNAIMNASVERTASSGDLESIEDVEEVTYIGSSMDDVLAALGPEETVAEYYYKVEGTPEADPEAFLSDIEAGMHKDALKEMLSNPSIGAVGSDPINTQIFTCVPDLAINTCFIYKGEMTVRHKDDISSEDANTIINELVKKTASSGDLESIEDVEKVTYIGSSMDDVLAAFGPEETVAEYYYKVEGTPEADPDAFLNEIEDGMQKGVLNVFNAMFINAIGSHPIDSEVTDIDCTPEVSGNTCYIYKGEMTVLHGQAVVSEDVNAIVNTSIERLASGGDLTSIKDVEKVTYIGSTIGDVIAIFRPQPQINKAERSGGEVAGFVLGPLIAAAALIILAACLVQRKRPNDDKSQHGLVSMARSISFVRANSKNLAAAHSTHNVHTCSSATCEKCLNRKQGGVAFIKTGAKPMEPIDELDETISFEDLEICENSSMSVSARAKKYDSEPGHFHLGQFHYRQTGERYLSPSCKLCSGNR